jgi:hypothetical protein
VPFYCGAKLLLCQNTMVPKYYGAKILRCQNTVTPAVQGEYFKTLFSRVGQRKKSRVQPEWFLESPQVKIMFILSRHLRSNIITVQSYQKDRQNTPIDDDKTWPSSSFIFNVFLHYFFRENVRCRSRKLIGIFQQINSLAEKRQDNSSAIPKDSFS